MPYIKRKKKGAFPSWTGNSSYEMIEVDDSGNPIMKEMAHATKRVSLTEAKIGPGLRAPDVRKGHTKNFDYHEWNRLRAKGLVGKKKKKK